MSYDDALRSMRTRQQAPKFEPAEKEPGSRELVLGEWRDVEPDENGPAQSSH